MPTPPKPFSVLMGEGRSHKTKSELDARRAAEEAALTGSAMREAPRVKKDEMAHAVFCRIKRLLKAIGKADAIYEHVINRYCLMASEADRLAEDMRRCEQQLEALDISLHEGTVTPEEFEARANVIVGIKQNANSALERKRKMMLDIEKENLMTVAAALRAIPKKPDETEKEDPMARLLRERMGG